MGLKMRVMPTLLYDGVELVKGVQFDAWRRVGAVMQAVKVYNMRQVDELVFLDIRATRAGRPPDFALIDDIADECFMPLCVGGGIRTVEHVAQLLRVGADKVAINTAAVEQPQLVSNVSARFGAQCVVVSLDVRRVTPDRWEVYTHSGTQPTGRSLVDVAKQLEAAGAGEILITSIDQDGTMAGYDLAAIRAVATAVSIPVIASGGAGQYQDLVSALTTGGASAVAAASIFHFTHQTPLEAKQALSAAGLHVRL